ncbi:MAG TPA: 16S rRNA (guanine(966)-N(2))-methyltransferase RsmD [Parachlamydiaceae bacterium]|nr:16S rRNA (guanine(966)-N(2))-methyltransferase RsmD [Parachlamydiaceae bacterium]
MHIVSGKFKNQKLIVPKGSLTRPTSSRLRESLFNICQSYIEDVYFLDIFAGSGAIGFEALSRGAKHVTFIDSSKEAIKAIQDNAKKLSCLQQTTILYGDVFEQLAKLEKREVSFDIIYADPPYDAFKGDLSFSALILEMVDKGNLLNRNGELFIEDSSDSIPSVKNLQTLKLKSARKSGRSFLQQYIVV